jgi:probable addiction module antidote protein
MAKAAQGSKAARLDTAKAIADHLTDAFGTGDSEVIARAIGNAARDQGMMRISKEAGVSRENLYRTLRDGRNPELSTVIKVLNALGIQLVAKPTPFDPKSPPA